MVCRNTYSLFLAFVKELPLMAFSLLPPAIMLHVLILISANIIGPGDELDITFLSKLIRKHQIDLQPPLCLITCEQKSELVCFAPFLCLSQVWLCLSQGQQLLGLENLRENEGKKYCGEYSQVFWWDFL